MYRHSDLILQLKPAWLSVSFPVYFALFHTDIIFIDPGFKPWAFGSILGSFYKATLSANLCFNSFPKK